MIELTPDDRLMLVKAIALGFAALEITTEMLDRPDEHRRHVAGFTRLMGIFHQGDTLLVPRKAGDDELRRRARAVVDEHYRAGGEWEDLSQKIAELADLVGGGEP